MSDTNIETSLIIIGRERRRGRPRSEQPKAASITAWVAPEEYDRLLKMANAREQSLSSLARHLLVASSRKK